LATNVVFENVAY